MNDDQLLRYSRHILLPEIDVEGQQALLDARALIVGAGGLGSPAAMYLAAAGVGTLVLADHDTVDLTNLQRQIMHSADMVGLPRSPRRAPRCIDSTRRRAWSRFRRGSRVRRSRPRWHAPTWCSTAPTTSPLAMPSTAPA